MKKAFTLACTLIGIICTTNAQTYNFPGIEYSEFGRIEVKGEEILVQGSCDQLWYSANQGQDWSTINININGLRGIALVPGQQSALINSSSGIYHVNIIDGSSIQIYEGNTLSMHYTNNKIYAFEQDKTSVSELSNPSWTVLSTTSNGDYGFTSSETSEFIYIGSRQGAIYRIDKTNDQIEPLTSVGSWVTNISMTDNQTGYILHQNHSAVKKTTDGGQSWVDVPGLPEAINPIAYQNHVWTINTNRIYHSDDGGLTSRRITTANSREFALTSNATITENGRMYIVGRGNMIAYSDDFGETFTQIDPYNRSSFFAIDIKEDGVGYAVGTFGSALQTIDGGQSWSELDAFDFGHGTLQAVLAMSDGSALIGSARGLYRVIQNNATEILQGEIRSLYQGEGYILALNSSNGTSKIWRSTDNGNNWTTVWNDGVESFGKFSQALIGGAIYVTHESGYYKSNDLGVTWENVVPSLTGLSHVSFYDENIGLFSQFNRLYKTTDGGNTFDQVGSGYLVRNVTIVDQNTYFYTTASNDQTRLTYTTDGGDTWKTGWQSCAQTHDISMLSSTRYATAQAYGHITVLDLPLISDTKDISRYENDKQIYPNPCNVGETLYFPATAKGARLYNSQGEYITEVDTRDGRGQLPNVNSGIYMLIYWDDSGLCSQKILVRGQ